MVSYIYWGMPNYVSEPLYKFWKRVIDIIGSSVGLLFFFILYPFVALAITIDSRGPIIVKLERISEGRRVYIYKFRSMVKNAKELTEQLKKAGKNERVTGPFFKIKRDPRITRVGR